MSEHKTVAARARELGVCRQTVYYRRKHNGCDYSKADVELAQECFTMSHIPDGLLLKGYQTYYGAVTGHPLFTLWREVAHKHNIDVEESIECGIMSSKHFDEFLKFVSKLNYYETFEEEDEE